MRKIDVSIIALSECFAYRKFQFDLWHHMVAQELLVVAPSTVTCALRTQQKQIQDKKNRI